MSAIFGSQWESQYGEVGGDTFYLWERELDKFKLDDVVRGIQTAKELAEKAFEQTGQAWPPNLPSFKAMCRKIKNQSHQLFLPTPKPDISVFENGAKRMAQLRAGLKA